MSDFQKDRRTKIMGLILIVVIAVLGVIILALCGAIRISPDGPDGQAGTSAGGAGAGSADPGNVFDSAAIIAETDAADSTAVFSEEEVVSYLRLRGFSGSFVTSSFDMNGNYLQAKPAAADSDERHPYYETYYAAQSGQMWDVLVIDGCVFATSEDGLVVSETETITVYDDDENRFCTVDPSRLNIMFRTVKRIDSYALDHMTPNA